MIQFTTVLLVVLIGHAFASAQTPTRVMSGYAATSGPHAALWIARDALRFQYRHLGSVCDSKGRLAAGERYRAAPTGRIREYSRRHAIRARHRRRACRSVYRSCKEVR